MIEANHPWRFEKAEECVGSWWTLYVCDECGSTLQVEYFPSGEPCSEHEAVSPLSETAA